MTDDRARPHAPAGPQAPATPDAPGPGPRERSGCPRADRPGTERSGTGGPGADGGGVPGRPAERLPGELFGPCLELFADVLGLGLATALVCLPLVTAPAALATACAALRRRARHGESAGAARFLTGLRARPWRRDLAAGGVLLAAAALFALDAALAAAGLPGAGAFAPVLAGVGACAAVVGLRACARPCAGADWPAAVRQAAARAVRDPGGSVLVLLALATAVLCAWALPPALFLVPGPLAVALTAVEHRARPRRGARSRRGHDGAPPPPRPPAPTSR